MFVHPGVCIRLCFTEQIWGGGLCPKECKEEARRFPILQEGPQCQAVWAWEGWGGPRRAEPACQGMV